MTVVRIIIFVFISAASISFFTHAPGSATLQTQTFDVAMMCTEPYMVEPGALSFLSTHGFDFNKQVKLGLPYHKGDDAEDEVG